MADITGSPLQEIQAALLGSQALEEGLNKISTNRALLEAEQAINTINTQITDERQRMQEFTKLGQGLAMRLSTLGMDAAGIEQTVGRLAPSVSAQFQAQENMRLQQSSQAFQASEGAKDRALRREQFTEEKRIRAEERSAKGQQDFKRYFIQKVAKNDTAALDLIEGAHAVYDESGPSQTAILQYKRALTKLGGEDRINQGDLELMEKYPAMRSRILKKIGIEITGEADMEEAEFFRQVAQSMENKVKRRIANKLRTTADSQAKHFNADAEQLGLDTARELLLEDVYSRERAVATLPSIWRGRLKSNIPPEDAEILNEIAKMSKEEVQAAPEALALLKKYKLPELK